MAVNLINSSDTTISQTSDDIKIEFSSARNQQIQDLINKKAVPVGTINIYAGSSAPNGWLMCDGSSISRDDYADLFDVIGTTYGEGDGETTFNLPNLQGKVPVGFNSSDLNFDTLGETGGEKTHTLTVNEMPAHAHYLSNNGSAYAITVNALEGGNNYNMHYTGGASENGPYVIADSVGGSQAHNIMQPYVVLNYIISY